MGKVLTKIYYYFIKTKHLKLIKHVSPFTSFAATSQPYYTDERTQTRPYALNRYNLLNYVLP
jgi:hypothetical protein